MESSHIINLKLYLKSLENKEKEKDKEKENEKGKEKQKAVCTMKRSRTKDLRVPRNSLM